MNEKNLERKEPITAVLVGAGSRGKDAYGRYALKHPDRIKFIAVADIDPVKGKMFQDMHNIPDDMVFQSWEDLLDLKRGKIAQTAFICTPDRFHYEPTIRALELDYDIFLEKPIAPTLEQCQNIEKLAKQKNRLVQIGHVLRFTDFFKKVKEIIDSGRIGKVIHYQQSENVSYWHFGHSYVRGAYKNKDTSNPVILAKTCHDLDIIYWMLGMKPEEVQSTGELIYYKPENAPPDAPERCTDGCPHSETCPWYAPRLYIDVDPLLRVGLEAKSKLVNLGANLALNHKGFIKFLSKFIKPLQSVVNWNEFPVSAITTDLTYEGKMKALKDGPFGLCIYKCGNDVVDHQVATYTFADKTTASLLVHGFSEWEGREVQVFGTKGVLRGEFRFQEEKIRVTDFRYRNTEVVYESGLNLAEGHGGGDFGLMDKFTAVFLGELSAEEAGVTDISGAMESHYMGFAAEDSRLSHSIRKLKDFRPENQ